MSNKRRVYTVQIGRKLYQLSKKDVQKIEANAIYRWRYKHEPGFADAERKRINKTLNEAYRTDSDFRAKTKANSRAYYAKNPEYAKQYYRKNRKKILARAKKQYAAKRAAML